jgi:ribosomal protein S6
MSRRSIEVELIKDNFEDIDTQYDVDGKVIKEVEREIKIKRRVNRNRKVKGKDKWKSQFSR